MHSKCSVILLENFCPLLHSQSLFKTGLVLGLIIFFNPFPTKISFFVSHCCLPILSNPNRVLLQDPTPLLKKGQIQHRGKYVFGSTDVFVGTQQFSKIKKIDILKINFFVIRFLPYLIWILIWFSTNQKHLVMYKIIFMASFV
jgi:hypothetical protein